MFIDKITITATSGKGGDGAISFRREKYEPDGGPNGGDGGNGGSIIFVADQSMNNLGAFRYKRKFVAENGEPGGKQNKSGKNAPDLYIQVPVGAVIFDNDTGKLICDMLEDKQEFVACQGGRGGRGNQHFATSTRQAPRFAKPGDDAETKNLTLELKTIADVGLVGFPNVGKSTLLSVVSNARPKIANYHFTTLTPNLGMVRHKNAPEFVLADIPGLIEGASEGSGLGHEFLRHVERTRMLIHVIDASGSEGRDPLDDFEKINEELSAYSPVLGERKQVVALNKTDLIFDDEGRENLAKIKEELSLRGYDVFEISAATAKGVEELFDYVVSILPEIPATPTFFTQEEIEEFAPDSGNQFEIEVIDGVYYVTGEMPRRLLRTVNLEDYESSNYFQRTLKNKGVFSALEKAGIQDGDTLDICGYEFEYYK